MSFKMTVMVIFWIIVVTIIVADLVYMFVKSKKNIEECTEDESAEDTKNKFTRG